MKRTTLFIKNFNWRMLLMRIVVNMLAVLLTLLLVPRINLVTRSMLAWIWLAVALGVLNAVIKPIIQVLTLRFIFATAGLVVILINTLMLLLLAWFFPQQLSVGGILWALLGGAVLGLSSTFLENLLGLSPPIVSEKYPEIRQRVKDRQFYRTQAELVRIEAQKSGMARELAVTKAVVASTHPNVSRLVQPGDETEIGSGLATAADGKTALAPQPTHAELPVLPTASAPVADSVTATVPAAVAVAAGAATALQQQEK